MLLVATLAVSSCADGGAEGGTRALADVERFTPAQFAAIEKVYVEAVRFQARGGSAMRRSPAALDDALLPLLTACGALAGEDRLLNALRDACAGQARFLRSASRAAGCSGAEGCSASLRTMRSGLRTMVGANRHGDRAVRETSLSSACKRVLVTPRSRYVDLRRADRALTRVIGALDVQNARELASAANALRRLSSKQTSSARQDLAAFRAHCRGR